MKRATAARTFLTLALISFLSGWPVPYRVQAAAGDLDLTFGNGGKVVTDFSGNPDRARAIAIQADGKILVAGNVEGSNRNDFGLARHDSDGGLDASFGSGGLVTTDFFGFGEGVGAMTLQPDGKIILADSANPFFTLPDIALARYNIDGSLDATFGIVGKITTDFGRVDEAYAIAIQTDGGIVMAGDTSPDSFQSDFALARYSTFNLCLQDESNGNLLQIDTSTGGYQFSNCNGLTIGGTGIVTRRVSTITLQHNANDRRVSAKLDMAVNRGAASIQVLSQGATLSITDRNITNNTCACKAIL